VNTISHIAIPYSRALFGLALETNQLEEIYKDAETLYEVCKSNREFGLMLKSPIIQTSLKLKIITSIFGNKIAKLTLSFLSLITRKKREVLIPDIALAFIDLYKDHKGILPTHLKTAGPITDALRSEVTEIMKKFTGKEIELIPEVDEELIGGFVLQWNDKQYDSSILSQIKEMRKSLTGKK
jgi:F-type H+-transporting ATPase subunit delta